MAPIHDTLFARTGAAVAVAIILLAGAPASAGLSARHDGGSASEPATNAMQNVGATVAKPQASGEVAVRHHQRHAKAAAHRKTAPVRHASRLERAERPVIRHVLRRVPRLDATPVLAATHCN